MTEFSIGDICKLTIAKKSVNVVVAKILENDFIVCEWLDDNNGINVHTVKSTFLTIKPSGGLNINPTILDAM